MLERSIGEVLKPCYDEHCRPVGILALVLAFAIAVAGVSVAQAYATRLTEGYAHAVAGQNLPIKRLQLTFQRAALADGHLLPIYGSSELYCCGDPYRGAQLFADRDPHRARPARHRL